MIVVELFMENIEQPQQMQQLQNVEQSTIQTKNPYRLIIIILSIVVVGMIGLCLFLVQKISKIDNKYETLQSGLNETALDVNDQAVVSITPVMTKNVSQTTESKNYLMLKEWGLKFEIPEDLTNIKYTVDGDTAYFVAEPADQSLNYVSSIDSLIKSDAMAVLYRKINSSEEGMTNVIEGKKVGVYYYYTAWSFSGTASGVGVQGSIFGADLDRNNEEDQKIEDKATEVWQSLNDMLKTIEVN